MFPPFDRIPNPVGVPLKGIQMVRSLQLRGEDLVARRFQCFECSVRTLCDACQTAKGVCGKTATTVASSESTDDGNEEEERDEEEEDAEREEDGNSDDDESSEDDSEEEEEEEGDEEEEEDQQSRVVWAPFR